LLYSPWKMWTIIHAMLKPKNRRAENFFTWKNKFLPKRQSNKQSFKNSNTDKNCKQSRTSSKIHRKLKHRWTKSVGKQPNFWTSNQPKSTKDRNKFKRNGLKK
jgi:hypothetical protein